MELKKGAHIHMMGICGTAMASLAGLLKDRGFRVTGSDSNPYPPMSSQIESLGIEIQRGYKAGNLNPRPDFVIVGNVISAHNEEAQELMRLQIPYTSLPKAMGDYIIEDRDCICISGTHGKTTTTSLMAWVAEICGQRPGFMIGGVAKNFSQSFKNPQGNLFVIEGDEYDTAFFDKVPKFVHYKPKYAVLTSVEFDHADIYKDLDDVRRAFARLIGLLPTGGHLICWADDANIQELQKKARCPVTTYGINSGDVQARILKTSAEGTEFSVQCRGEDLGVYRMEMSGEYNVLNALAVVTVAKILQFPQDEVKEAFQSFEGIKRRQEVLGEPRGVLIIEDFAHHPTAVRETIKGVKMKYPQRKLWAVFEPRSATSRRKIFQKDYGQAFEMADEILIAEAFDQSKIQESERFSSAELVNDLKANGKFAHVYTGADQIVEDLVRSAKKGDMILIMSNGGFDGIYGKLMNGLQMEAPGSFSQR